MSEFAEGYAVGQGNTNNGFGWGGEWIWIIVLFALWQNGGFGFGGGGREGYATQADVRAAVDQQTLISKLDQQTYGLADSTYALNNTINQNFRGVDNAICNLGHQMSECCCATQRLVEKGFADTNYNLATQACDTRNLIQNVTRDIIDSQNNGTRAILDALTAQRIEAKDSKIAEQNQMIFSLQLAASQAAQNNYIIGQLRPAPVPSYAVPNPYAGYYGNFGGCGCTC